MDRVKLPTGFVLLSDVVEYLPKIREFQKLALHGIPTTCAIYAQLLNDMADKKLSTPTGIDDEDVYNTAYRQHLITGDGQFRVELRACTGAFLSRVENGPVRVLHLYNQVKDFTTAQPFLIREIARQMEPGAPFSMGQELRAACVESANESPDRLIRLMVEAKHQPMFAPYQVKNWAILHPGEVTLIDRPIT